MDVEGRPPVVAWPAWDLAADPRGRHRVDQPGSDTEDHSVCLPRQHDPQPLADHRRTLTAETMESPVLSNGHAGFGERPGETDRRQHRHRAPGRLNRCTVLAQRMCDQGLYLPLSKIALPERHLAHHPVAGHHLLVRWLVEWGWQGRAARAWGVALGGHHGVP